MAGFLTQVYSAPHVRLLPSSKSRYGLLSLVLVSLASVAASALTFV